MNRLAQKYKEPTPPAWRRMGDFALVLIPVVEIAIHNAPPEAISPVASYWLSQAAAVLLVAFKFWTNTHSVHQPNPFTEKARFYNRSQK